MALRTFFVEPLATVRGWSEVAVKMTPLLLCSVGLVVCFRANVWNIGAEGQLIAAHHGWRRGALRRPGDGARLRDPRHARVRSRGRRVGRNYGPFAPPLPRQRNSREPHARLRGTAPSRLGRAGSDARSAGFGFPQTRLFDAGALLPVLIEGTRFHAGALLALISAVGIWILMDKMALGFQFKISGMAPLAARYAGYRPGHLIWASMLISGALAGLAGGIEATGPLGQLTPTISPGYGFAAIIVAFVIHHVKKGKSIISNPDTEVEIATIDQDADEVHEDLTMCVCSALIDVSDNTPVRRPRDPQSIQTSRESQCGLRAVSPIISSRWIPAIR